MLLLARMLAELGDVVDSRWNAALFLLVEARASAGEDGGILVRLCFAITGPDSVDDARMRLRQDRHARGPVGTVTFLRSAGAAGARGE